MSTSALDLGATLRQLRRRADLSQRELAERAGVPASTVARIEAGNAVDPRFRTVERLVAAAGGAITAGRAAVSGEHPNPAPEEPLRDEAGRRYPAHLDVRRVDEARDWWGGWWANWYDLPRNRWPRPAPDYTFDLDRARRDERRRSARGRAMVARLRLERLESGGNVPENVWRWVARDEAGEIVGRLGGYVRTRRIDRSRELVVADIEVVPAWQRLGLGRRLLDAMRAAMVDSGVARAWVLIDESDLPYQFFRECGFLPRGPQPLLLERPALLG